MVTSVKYIIILLLLLHVSMFNLLQLNISLHGPSSELNDALAMATVAVTLAT